LDEAAGLKKQAETVMVEMMAKTNSLNGSWNRHSAVSHYFVEHLSLFNTEFFFPRIYNPHPSDCCQQKIFPGLN